MTHFVVYRPSRKHRGSGIGGMLLKTFKSKGSGMGDMLRKSYKGKGLGALIGMIARGVAKAAPTIARTAKTAARGGMRAARNPNNWKALGKRAAMQAASLGASETINAITKKKKRPHPDYWYKN